MRPFLASLPRCCCSWTRSGRGRAGGLGQGVLRLAVVFARQQSISQWLLSKRLALWLQISAAFHCQGACGLQLSLIWLWGPAWHGCAWAELLKSHSSQADKGLLEEEPGEDGLYSHLATDPSPSFFRSFKKFLRSLMIISVTLLHLVLLLMYYVQVSFIPSLEMLPFFRRHLT